MLDISVVIPLFNEDESIPELYAWIERVMKENHFTYEVIFVNDGSTDRSWEVITELAEQSDLFVRIHRGYLVNLQHVKKNHGAVVSMSNGDTLSVSRSLAVAFKEALLKYVRASAR